MLKWALIFLVISLAAGALGFTGVSSITGTLSKILFGICFIIFLLFVILAFVAGEILL
jgi:uncharacterized membrane protein YtjA (UPF0391 family)